MRKRRQLSLLQDQTTSIGANDILLVTTIRNERQRLPYFLKYYRALGINHFLIIDNGSTDGTAEYLARFDDVSVWRARGSYRAARYGMDWCNWILRRYAHGHWALTVDADEFLVYPFVDTRPLQALTEWLDGECAPSFPTMLVDMYPKGPIDQQTCEEGQNPLELACWFDRGNYCYSRNKMYENLWIQGGPRARVFFPMEPAKAPSLNKIPLVKWHRSYVYVSSTHALLPRRLNRTYATKGGERISGCLLHAKFIDTFIEKTAEELKRREHFAGSQEYIAYNQALRAGQNLWCEMSERYINWRQLEVFGLMSKGSWA